MALDPQLFTITQAANALGIDHRTLRRRIGEVKPAGERQGRGGAAPVYRLADIVDALVTDATGKERAKPQGFEEAQRRKLAAEAELVELKLERERGELVHVDDAAAAWSNFVLAARARLLAVPSKLAPMVAAETKVQVCRDLIEAAIHECANELAGGRWAAVDVEPGGDAAPAKGGARKRKPDQAAAKANGKRVGGSKKTPQRGSGSRAGPVEDQQGGVPAGDNGRDQRPRVRKRRGDVQRPGGKE